MRTSYYRRAITLQGGADALQLTPPIPSRRKRAARKLDRTRRNSSRCTPRTKIFLRTVCVSHLVLSPSCFPASDTRPTDRPSNLVRPCPLHPSLRARLSCRILLLTPNPTHATIQPHPCSATPRFCVLTTSACTRHTLASRTAEARRGPSNAHTTTIYCL
jgi:hypothetical protein